MLTARRTGGDKLFRQPEPRERDDIARPLARIACRYLPLDLIGDDLADITEAIVAGHNYVMDGPLIVPNTADEPFFADEFPDPEETP